MIKKKKIGGTKQFNSLIYITKYFKNISASNTLQGLSEAFVQTFVKSNNELSMANFQTIFYLNLTKCLFYLVIQKKKSFPYAVKLFYSYIK